MCIRDRAYLGGSSTNQGPTAYAATKKVFESEEKVWVNYSGDPSVDTDQYLSLIHI